jgi:hypothetical protein
MEVIYIEGKVFLLLERKKNYHFKKVLFHLILIVLKKLELNLKVYCLVLI